MFQRRMPGVTLLYDRHDRELGGGLRQLRAQGELAGFSDDALLTISVIGIWRKASSG